MLEDVLGRGVRGCVMQGMMQAVGVRGCVNGCVALLVMVCVRVTAGVRGCVYVRVCYEIEPACGRP